MLFFETSILGKIYKKVSRLVLPRKTVKGFLIHKSESNTPSL